MTDKVDIDLVSLQRIKAGDKNAFNEIFTRHEKPTFHLIKLIVGNDTDAEDIMMETFTKAYLKIGTFIPDNLFKTWLAKIATNTALDFIRCRTRRKTIDDIDLLINTIENQDPNQLQKIISGETRLSIREAINCLQPNYKQAIIRQINGYGNQSNLFRAYLFRARKQLKKLIA
jgi:RNA polymerase sigma-70 factor (ECF subfamily)